MNKTSRRKFILQSAVTGIGTMLITPALNKLSAAPATAFNGPGTGFDQQPLPYAFNELEPVIDALTMEIHYTKHAAAYAANLKEAAAKEGVNTQSQVEELLPSISKYSTKLRNNAGGHFNHELFWKTLSPKPTTLSGPLADAINNSFGSPEKFMAAFTDAAKSRFGSGWAWLIIDGNKKLSICSTPNQDNPLMDISEVKGFPLFGLDVWEHAYYLKYQNRRADYIAGFWKIINWDFVAERFAMAV